MGGGGQDTLTDSTDAFRGGGGSKVKKLMSFLNMFSPDIVV